MTDTKKIDGVSSGTVIEKNCRVRLAPSSDDASYISGGMLFIPADSTIRLKPSEIHIPTTPTATSANHRCSASWGL